MGVDRPPLIGFRRHFVAAEIPGEDSVYLVSARGTVALSGDEIRLLAPLLDGRRDLAEVQRRVAPAIGPERLGHLLRRLAGANLIAVRRPAVEYQAADRETPDRATPEHDPAHAYWDLAAIDADDAATRLAGTRIRPMLLAGAASGLDLATVGDVLRAAGLTVDADGTDPDALTVVLCDDYLDPRLAGVTDDLLARGRPWLLAKPTGPDVWTGPLFRPAGGPCWNCLAHRLRGRRRGELALREACGPLTAPEASLPATRALGLHVVALETAKYVAGMHDDNRDTIWTLDTLTLRAQRHPVRRRPQCTVCGDPALAAAAVGRRIEPAARPKAVVHGNGHRALPPEQVWQRFRHLADPVTGITDLIRRDRRGPQFVHNYLSGHNAALAGNGRALRPGLRQQSGGKGSTDLEARVGALCEAVERYCGSRLGDEPTLRASFRELGERAVHPSRCLLFHERQYRDRRRWNAAHTAVQRVPEPFDDGEPIEWTPAWSLTAGRERLLPTDLMYFNAAGHPSLRADSNGNAAGASIEDAIVQGFLELVERDAVALWWYNRTRQAAVALDSFDDPWISGLRGRYATIARDLWVLDVTSDLDIPAMVAVSRRTDKPAEDLMLGFGAHFDPRVAARRALTELGQFLPAAADARADGSGYDPVDEHILHWWRTATVGNQPYLFPDASVAPRDRAGYGHHPRADLRADLEHIVALAGRAGLEVLVLDQTRPDVAMPVVKVIVPGLRHFWARFAPGRLYDLPVQLGRLDTPTPYAGLNPTPLFM